MTQKIQGIAILAVWSIVTFLLLKHTPLAIHEGAAKALLLDWSIGDQVASSVVTLGIPDFRAIIWVPLGFLWPGQIIAAKIVMILLMALSVYLLYKWHLSYKQEETALLASGLALISPLTLVQIDQLNPGLMVLITIVLGAYLDRAYRETQRLFGGYYFAQLLLVLFAVTLHPMGLAYGIALLIGWYKDKTLGKLHQKSNLAGLALALLVGLLLRWGWKETDFALNPLPAAATVILGQPLDVILNFKVAALGLLVMLIAAITLVSDRKNLFSNLFSRSLALAILFGLVSGDQNWGYLLLMFLLNVTLPWVLKPRDVLLQYGFMVQRGWLWVILFVLSTLYLQADRDHFYIVKNNLLTGQDQLIQTFADDVDLIRKVSDQNSTPMPKIRAASQWPARTMMACRCDVLPLPPVAENPDKQLSMLKGITHLLFVPNENKNLGLTQNLSQLGDKVETVSLQPGGVILHIKSMVVK